MTTLSHRNTKSEKSKLVRIITIHKGGRLIKMGLTIKFKYTCMLMFSDIGNREIYSEINEKRFQTVLHINSQVNVG